MFRAMLSGHFLFLDHYSCWLEAEKCRNRNERYVPSTARLVMFCSSHIAHPWMLVDLQLLIIECISNYPVRRRVR